MVEGDGKSEQTYDYDRWLDYIYTNENNKYRRDFSGRRSTATYTAERAGTEMNDDFFFLNVFFFYKTKMYATV